MRSRGSGLLRVTMVERLDFESVRVEPDLILRLQGYRRLDAVPPAVREVARRMAAMAETLVEPQGWAWRGPVSRIAPEGAVAIGDDVQFVSRALARALANAVEAIIVVLTIGPHLERRAHELVGNDDLVEGLLLDTAGWVAIDALLKETRARLAADARPRGCRLTARLAPGFADWGLEQQHLLFAAFNGTAMTVTLTDTQVMLPRKSVSGLYGLVPRAAGAGAAGP